MHPPSAGEIFMKHGHAGEALTRASSGARMTARIPLHGGHQL